MIPLSYSKLAPLQTGKAITALLIAGIVHGSACVIYLTQRIARWWSGDETTLQVTQSAVPANLGMILQASAATFVVVLCVARVRSVRYEKPLAIAAGCLGVSWLFWGLLDCLPLAFEVRFQWEDFRFRYLVMGIISELNQILLPLLILIVFARTQVPERLVGFVYGFAMLSCLTFALRAAIDLSHASAMALNVNWSYFRESVYGGAIMLTAFLLLALVRRPSIVIGSIPLVAFLARDIVVNGPARYAALSQTLTWEIVFQQARQISFMVITAGTATTAFILFAVLRVPVPSIRFWRKPLPDPTLSINEWG